MRGKQHDRPQPQHLRQPYPIAVVQAQDALRSVWTHANRRKPQSLLEEAPGHLCKGIEMSDEIVRYPAVVTFADYSDDATIVLAADHDLAVSELRQQLADVTNERDELREGFSHQAKLLDEDAETIESLEGRLEVSEARNAELARYCPSNREQPERP